MARDPSQGTAEGAPERGPAPTESARQRLFGESGGDDGWTLIGPAEEPVPEPDPASTGRVEDEVEVEVDIDVDVDVEPEPEPATAVAEPQFSADPFASPIDEPTPSPQVAAPNAAPPPVPRTAPRAPTAPARRTALPSAIAALALVALGALAWRHARVVRALEHDLAAERARAAAPSALPEDVEAELARLRTEAERLERELVDVARRASEAEAAVAREGAASERAAALAAERDGLSGELSAARERLDALGAELERARERSPAPALGPDARRAEVCERLLGRVEAGQGAAARAVLEAGIAAGLFARGARDGTEFLGELAAAAEALERARVERATSTAPATAAALASFGNLQRAREFLPDLERDAADWLARDVRGGTLEPPAARAQRIERALAGLEAEGARLGDDVDALHGADWTWITSRGPLQDPELAREHAATFGCGHLAELAQAAAERLRQDCLADGTPEPERLLAAGCLPAWAAILGAAAERGAGELELLWLDAARRWYAAGAPAADFEWHGLAAPPIEQRARDWRAELWLRVQLAAPDSAWPPRPGEVALYHLSGPSRAHWRSDRRVDDGAPGGWTWLRTHFDESGATLGEPALVAVELDGERARLAEAELVLLDLRAAQPGCEVAPAPVLPLAAPPAATGFGDREVLGRAAEATRSTCLVVRQGDTTRWFSPRLGLVREERELPGGTARVELALREVAP